MPLEVSPGVSVVCCARNQYGTVTTAGLPGSGAPVLLAASPAVLALSPSPFDGELVFLRQFHVVEGERNKANPAERRHQHTFKDRE